MKRKTISKITMTTGIIAMSIGLINAFSLETQAATTTGGKLVPYVQSVPPAKPGGETTYKTVCNPGTVACTPTDAP